jgi:flagellar basal body-associated protein FliL
MRLPELTNDQITLLVGLLAAGMVIFVFWLGTRESNRWQALQDRAEQAEARVNQPADPLLPYTRIPTAEIRCEEPADGYCGRYVLYRLTAAD